MHALRKLLITIAIFIPASALASTLTDPPCCSSHCCPGCPFCHHH